LLNRKPVRLVLLTPSAAREMMTCFHEFVGAVTETEGSPELEPFNSPLTEIFCPPFAPPLIQKLKFV